MKVCADPGKFKTGFAVTDDDGNLIFSAVIPAKGQPMLAESFINKSLEKIAIFKCEGNVPETFDADEILIGNGTTHKKLLEILKDCVQCVVADEYGTTLEGRRLYWKLHPPRGIWKIIPRSLCLPPRDIDDLAAWAIILKQLKQE